MKIHTHFTSVYMEVFLPVNTHSGQTMQSFPWSYQISYDMTKMNEWFKTNLTL